MSVPPELQMPPGCRRVALPTARGALNALVLDPPRPDRFRGRPVLLVPGFTGSKEDFLPVLRPIADAGHPVVAIDLRGQFGSGLDRTGSAGDGPDGSTGAGPDGTASDGAGSDGAGPNRSACAGPDGAGWAGAGPDGAVPDGAGSAGAGSDGPDPHGADRDEHFGVAALGADVLDLLAGFDRPAHLLGHSYGGLVARAATLRAPDRVATLTLLGSGPAAVPAPAADRLGLLRPILEHAGVAGVFAAQQALETAEPGYVPPPPAVADFLRRRFLAMPTACLRGMAQGLLDEPDRVAELAATGVPILVTHGADDDAWPPAVQAEMARRLDAQYAVVPDAVHSPAVENPAGTATVLLDFWRSHDARSG